MSTERPKKNFMTSTGEPEAFKKIGGRTEELPEKLPAPTGSVIFFENPEEITYNGGVSTDSKRIKKPKNKLNLNKFHQPIFKKESEKKQLKKKARDLQRLIEKEDVHEEVKEAKKTELEDVQKKIETKGKQQKRQDRKIKFLQQKYKEVMNVEMKKVNRMLEKNTRLLEGMAESYPAYEKLIAEKKDLQMKFNYIRHFPNDKKYMSLFPKNEEPKMVALRNKIMKDIQSRVDQKQRFLNKVELDPSSTKVAEEPEKKSKKKSKKIEVEEEAEEDTKIEIEEEKKKLPKLTKKIVDNFFVTPETVVETEKTQAKEIGKDGKVIKPQTTYKKDFKNRH